MNASFSVTPSQGNTSISLRHSGQPRALDRPFSSKIQSLKAETPILRISVDKDLEHFLERELSVERLNKISKYLWIAGSGKVRPLHHQIVMEREIIITESTELHLCWQNTRIYIKPLPRFLLDLDFFATNLCSASYGTEMKKDQTLHANACGFLKSYTQLIVHESDFRIAKDIMLIPEELSWDEWRQYSVEVDKYIYERTHEGRLQLNPRYRFGELRIQRLNLIYKLRMKESRGFHYGYTSYETFFLTNFAWMALVFAFFTIVLSALQTALASDNAGANSSLHFTAYWFGVVVLLAVGGGTVALGALFSIMFFDNLVFAVKGGKKKPPRPSSGASNV